MGGFKAALTIITFVLTAWMYVPLFWRILKRKQTGDFSKQFQWSVFALQVNNLLIALSEHAEIFTAYYIVQVILVLVTNILVHKYYEGGENGGI